MRAWKLGLVLLAMVVGCSADKVPTKDAMALAAALEATKAADPESRPALLAQACSDLAGCAGKCQKGLHDYAKADVATRPKALIDGCAEASGYVRSKGEADANKEALDFIKDRLSKYAYRARQTLDGKDRKRV